MSESTDPLTRGEFYAVIDKLTTSLGEELNKAFGFVYQRFDDMEARLERIETRLARVEDDVRVTQVDVNDVRSNMHDVRNDTRLIHPIFEWARTENAEFGELKVRVEKLEKKS